MTDEGQRQLKVLDLSVDWYDLEYTPLIQLHFLTNRSPPLISHNKNIGSEVPLFCCDSFPPGEAKWCKPLACTLYYSSTFKSSAHAIIILPLVTGTHHSCSKMASADRMPSMAADMMPPA